MHSPPQPSASPHRRPTHEGVHAHRSGLPPQLSPSPVHIVPGAQVPPQPSLGVSPQGRVEGGEQVGAQQSPARQRSPAGQRVPTGHIAQPAGSLGSTPQSSELAEAHAGQQVSPSHVVPPEHMVPLPQVRQTRPIASMRSGMSTPQATLPPDGHAGQHEPMRHSEPDAHIVPVPQSRHTVPPAITSGTGAPHAVIDADGQPPQHTRASASLPVPGGLVQLVPDGHIEPKPLQSRHAKSGMGSPQATEPPEAQLGQQVPLAQLMPEPQPPVPRPVQSRHTRPIESRTSGMSVPHATDEGSAHAPQQLKSVLPPPGRSTQAVPPAHIVPVPLQVRQVSPPSSIASGISAPQGTLPAPGHRGQQVPSRQSSPPSQRVPTPVHDVLPMHVSGMSLPQSTMPAARQSSVQVHTPATHARPSAQGPMQSPPQPFGVPHVASSAHSGMHSQRPVSGLHSSRGPGQVPVQKPPQPSGSPHTASAAQRGMQVQVPAMHRAGASHIGSQPQVSMQSPF